jgi:2-hydroxy-3-keto-5-methylthiopentenyl-1-phosphate phosphatase
VVRPPARFFVACDFDGTITKEDTLIVLIERYAPEAWANIEPRMRRGETKLVDAIAEVFEHVRASHDEVVTYLLERAVIREGFAEFVDWLRTEGHELMVVSSGFRPIIEAIFERERLDGLRVSAGEVFFSTEGTVVSYVLPPPDECDNDCGCCKREAIAASRTAESTLVYLGDGVSDFCAAEAADVIFARRGLAHHLDSRGRQYFPLVDFHEVREVLERLAREGSN